MRIKFLDMKRMDSYEYNAFQVVFQYDHMWDMRPDARQIIAMWSGDRDAWVVESTGQEFKRVEFYG